MFRDTRWAFQKWAFYLGIPIAGELLANSLARIPGVSQLVAALFGPLLGRGPSKDGVDATLPPLSQGALFLVGLALLFGLAYLVKRRRKKEDFETLYARKAKETDAASQPEPDATQVAPAKRGLHFLFQWVGAIAVGATLFNSYPFLATLYNWVIGLPRRAFHSMFSGLGNAYDSLLVGEAWYTQIAQGTTGLLVGTLVVLVVSGLYRNAVSRKHGPILKELTVNGFTPWWGRWASGKNIGMHVSRAGIWQLDGYTHIPQDMRAVADVRVHDLVHGVTRDDGSIWYDRSTEPKPQRRSITREDIDQIKKQLLAHRKGEGEGDSQESGETSPLRGNEVREVLEKIDLQEALRPQYEGREDEMPADTDIRAVVELLSSEPYQEEDISKVSTEEIYKNLQQLPFYQEGGKFQRMFFEQDSVGVNVPLVTLDEQSRSSLRNTERYHGSRYNSPHKIKPVFIFRHLRGQDTESVEDAGAEDDSSDQEQIETAMNTIRQYRKRWNQLLRKGFGQAYTLLFHGNQYTIEEEWLSSIPIGANRRLRRKFYIRLGPKIVAKIQESAWTALTKWTGNNDRVIHVYEPSLARWDSMGRVLCLFSDYLASQNHYRQNRLSAALQTRGGMEDTLAGR